MMMAWIYIVFLFFFVPGTQQVYETTGFQELT